MKVLHIAYKDIAGVPSLLVDRLRIEGIEADLLLRKQDPCRFSNRYKPLNVSVTMFLLYVLIFSKNYDIVHLHGLPYKARFNMDVLALKILRRKLIVHLHGPIRRYYKKTSTKAALQICNRVLASTPDLLRYWPSATWLPNPIDSIFKPVNNPQRHGKALYIQKRHESLQNRNFIKKKSEQMNLKLTIPHQTIPYSEMPNLLNQFEVFFDQITIHGGLSKTALEALACGCKVISWKGLVKNAQEILEKHSLRNVIDRLLAVYSEFVNTC